MAGSTRAWILGGLAVAAAGVGIARLLADRPHIDEESRVLLLGDSHAQGLAPHLRTIAKEQGIPFHAVFRVGSTVDDWVGSPALVAALAEFQPTLILVVLGTNDAYLPDASERQTAAIEELVAELEAAGDVVWVLPLDLERYGGAEPDQELRQTIEDQAPSTFPSDELDIPRGPDGLHATAAGYGAWAGSLWNWLS
jgi:lysophospholipase L1-like esterase